MINLEGKITVLIEDTSDDHLNLKKEHGLSLFIETSEGNILFDTGNSENFINNAEQLNVDLRKTDHIVLSHGHYDHTNGFRGFIEKFGNHPIVHAGESFFVQKYSYDGVSYKFSGMNFDQKFIQDNHIKIQFVLDRIEKLAKDIYIITNFKKVSTYEKNNEKFFIQKDGHYTVDSFADEIMIAIKTAKGLVLIVGCSHPGIINMAYTAEKELNDKVYTIIGGTHLMDHDEKRVKETMDFFEESKIQKIGTCHCTGAYVAGIIKEKFKEKFIHCTTGTRISFP